MDVRGFNDQYRFLSNFYWAEVCYEGVKYPTSEHAYQAAKTLDFNSRRMIAKATTPGKAKRMGAKLTLRPNWEAVKVDIMYMILLDKFTRHPELAERLLAIDGLIEETNSWGDTFWGVCNGKGYNVLGKILMRIRDRLRKLGVK